MLYVGSSKDLLVRIRTHQRHLRKGKHPNRYLRSYLKQRKLKLESLTFSVLELCQPEDLLIAEQAWHNQLMPWAAMDVPDLATASDAFKLFVFSRILQRARKFR